MRTIIALGPLLFACAAPVAFGCTAAEDESEGDTAALNETSSSGSGGSRETRTAPSASVKESDAPMLISGKSEAPDALLRPLAGSIYTFVDPEFGYSFAFAADGRSAPVVNVVAPDPQRLTFVRPVIWCEEKAKTCSADGVMMIAFSSLSESGGALPWTMRVRIRAGDAGLIPRPSATFTATVGDISYNKLAQRK